MQAVGPHGMPSPRLSVTAAGVCPATVRAHGAHPMLSASILEADRLRRGFKSAGAVPGRPHSLTFHGKNLQWRSMQLSTAGMTRGGDVLGVGLLCLIAAGSALLLGSAPLVDSGRMP